jgi:hypothetical protein
VLEVPHQGRGIQKVDGGDAYAGMGNVFHGLLDYQAGVKDSAAISPAYPGRQYRRA